MRYIQHPITHELIPADEYVRPTNCFEIMPDIAPYKSMIDGSVITSRSHHRAHLKAHGCIEIGNDSGLYKQRKPLESPPGLKETLIRVANEKLR